MAAAHQLTMQVQLEGAGAWGAWIATSASSQSGHRAAVFADLYDADNLAVRLFELRSAVEAMRGSGVHADTLHSTRTDAAAYGFGSPAAYQGMCFRLAF